MLGESSAIGAKRREGIEPSREVGKQDPELLRFGQDR